MKFYDAHIHNPGEEAGGFLVGLEGEPWFEENSSAFRVPGRILHNAEAAAIVDGHPDRYRFFRYVTRGEVKGRGQGQGERSRGEVEGRGQGERSRGEIEGRGQWVNQLLKFHPRREKYAPEEVIEAIGWMRPKAVMIDTLNEPEWGPYDYWKVCRAFPEITFLLPHAGGYLINDFIKICHFQKNVYIDFALTHTNFGGISKNPLPYVEQAIVYALNSPFKDRVLMGSDLPFFNQLDVVRYYEKLGKMEMLNANFERLFEQLGRT